MNFASFKNALGQVVQSASSSARDFGATVCGPRSEPGSLVSPSDERPDEVSIAGHWDTKSAS